MAIDKHKHALWRTAPGPGLQHTGWPRPLCKRHNLTPQPHKSTGFFLVPVWLSFFVSGVFFFLCVCFCMTSHCSSFSALSPFFYSIFFFVFQRFCHVHWNNFHFLSSFFFFLSSELRLNSLIYGCFVQLPHPSSQQRMPWRRLPTARPTARARSSRATWSS